MPTAEYRSVLDAEARNRVRVAYERRDPDLEPRLIGRGKRIREWRATLAPLREKLNAPGR